eukprot:1081285-Rhodomonas_salina.2
MSADLSPPLFFSEGAQGRHHQPHSGPPPPLGAPYRINAAQPPLPYSFVPEFQATLYQDFSTLCTVRKGLEYRLARDQE